MLSQAVEDYLKAVYQLQERQGQVTTLAVAERMGVAPASATNMIKKLAQMRLVRHTPYQGVELTPEGEKIALEVIRHHRLVELYLAQALGVPWDRVHQEAEKIEHILSEDLEDRIAAALGQPSRDPHGDPIPTKEGTIATPPQARLSEIAAGEMVVVSRVANEDPELLRYLGSLGLYPDVQLLVLEVAPFKGPLRVRMAGQEHILGRELAENIFVVPAQLQSATTVIEVSS